MEIQDELPTPTRSRAVFSTQDFALLQTAVREYVLNCEDPEKSMAYANLLHRLGRVV